MRHHHQSRIRSRPCSGTTPRWLAIPAATKISETIERYFGAWEQTVYLDYHHLQEKIYLLMSEMIIGKCVDDPTAPVEYYTRGQKRESEKPLPRHH